MNESEPLGFNAIPEPPPLKAGDAITIVEPDGTRTSLLVMRTEPLDGEDHRMGQSVEVIAWPSEEPAT